MYFILNFKHFLNTNMLTINNLQTTIFNHRI